MFNKQTQIIPDQINMGRWTKYQHRQFLDGLQLYGKNWKLIEPLIKTRTGSQIRSHAQKYFNKLERRREDPRHNFDSTSDFHLKEEFNLNDRSVSEKDGNTQKLIQENQKQVQTQLHSIENTKLDSYEPSYYLKKMLQYPLNSLIDNFFYLLIDIPQSRSLNGQL